MNKFYMPTQILEGDGIVQSSADVFKKLGKRALIVTGRSSAKKCGALDDVVAALDSCQIEYNIFDEVRENPPISQNYDGAVVGKGADFVIGIGGGSPMDTAKGIAILLKHGTADYVEKLFGKKDYDALPVVTIPTTAGTGSEATPYSVFTDDNLETKLSMARRVFPTYSLIDVKYFMTMPQGVRNSTIIDAYSHAVESYLNVNSTPYSELYALKAIELFGAHKDELSKEQIDSDIFIDFVRASTYAGVAIALTGTSLPHALGYPITYHYGVPHGIANGMFMVEYFKLSPPQRVATVLEKSGFNDLAEFKLYMDQFVKPLTSKIEVGQAKISEFVAMLMSNQAKLKNHPRKVTEGEILSVYNNSLA
ncbi:MAG: alcohol dehydrogenase [Clostridiales bacterium]|nr:MAG: alcohol dehydrogenase [Clostridiales bacterium]